jgi:biotin carboxyl carrier protein
VGTVRAINGVEVTTQIAGAVEKIHFKSGDHVKAGDLLVTLDASTDAAQLKALKAAAKLAQLEFERYESLYQQGSISKSELDRKRSERDQAEATAMAQREKVEQKSIRAPFDGQLGIRQVDVGQYRQVSEVGCVSGCSMLVTREFLHRVGPLDERFFAYYEDVDWCLRAHRSGLSVLYVPRALVWHPDPATRDEQNELVTYLMTRNSLLLLRKHRLGTGTAARYLLGYAHMISSWSLRGRWRCKRRLRKAVIYGVVDHLLGRYGQPRRMFAAEGM